MGYEQNPMRVYYCYEIVGSTTSINKCIGEVCNLAMEIKLLSILLRNFIQTFVYIQDCLKTSYIMFDFDSCMLQATNTPWGERVQFLFNINSDMVAKPLHLSPFMVLYCIKHIMYLVIIYCKFLYNLLVYCCAS